MVKNSNDHFSNTRYLKNQEIDFSFVSELGATS